MPDYDPQGRGSAQPRAHAGAGLSPVKITVATVLLILLLLLTHVSLTAVMRSFATKHADHSGTNGLDPLALGPQIPPAPRLQADPGADLATLQAEQNARLNSYGPIGKGQETVSIPIERAKALLLQRGLPQGGARPAPSPAPLPEEGADAR